MENTENRRKHYNLYYIFVSDKQEHPMSPEKVEEIRKYRQILFRKKTL